MYGYRKKSLRPSGRRPQPDWRHLARRHPLVAVLGLIAVLLAVSWVQKQLPGSQAAGRPRLVDGDSFFLGQDEVRLVGIDAPEGRQTCRRGPATWPCGEAARQELARLIGGRPIQCQSHERDQHGRLLATCSVDGGDLNSAMVASGLAVAYGNYRREEAEARAAKRGLWSGEFEQPRDWRRANSHGRD